MGPNNNRGLPIFTGPQADRYENCVILENHMLEKLSTLAGKSPTRSPTSTSWLVLFVWVGHDRLLIFFLVPANRVEVHTQ